MCVSLRYGRQWDSLICLEIFDEAYFPYWAVQLAFAHPGVYGCIAARAREMPIFRLSLAQ